ncbi:MAG: hypothetical protein GY814_01650 [Gammaproteobacteria bacterium]|nr:hypothetical protein [Gammaproteobacteria bacterium]
MRTVRNIYLVIAITLLLTGCQTIKKKDMADTLSRVLHSYELTARWGKLEQVYAFLLPELAKEAKIQEDINNIRVTHYEVVKQPSSVAENNEVIMQNVHIRYIYIDRQVEREMVDNQEWTYNDDRREWRRSNPIPKF